MDTLKYKADNKDPLAYGFDEKEEIIWQVSPSQYTNFGYYILSAIFLSGNLWLTTKFGYRALWTAPIFLGCSLYCYCDTWATLYILTSQRFIKRSGIFQRVNNEVELYKITSVQLYEPFFRRIFGLGNIHVDIPHAYFVVGGISKAFAHKEQLRFYVEKRKTEKRVVEIDNSNI